MSSKTSLVVGWVATKPLSFPSWLLQSPVQKCSRGLSDCDRKSHVLIVLKQQQCRSLEVMLKTKMCIQTFPFLASLCVRLPSELEDNCKV